MPRVKLEFTSFEPIWRQRAGDAVQGLAWRPDGEVCAIGLVGGQLAFCGPDADTLRPQAGHDVGLLDLAWRPDGSLLASAGQDGRVRLWHADGTAAEVLDASAAWIERLAWSADGKFLAVAAGKFVELWDFSTPGAAQRRHSWGPHAATVTDLAWQAGGKLAVASYGGVSLWHPDKATLQRHLPFKGSLLALAVSPNGRYYATGNQDGTVHLWYADTGHDLEMNGYPTKVRELAWDPKSRYVATGGATEVTIWDMRGRGPAGSKPLVLDAHTHLVSVLAFQPAGDQLASAGRDGNVIFWRPLRGNELRGRQPIGALELGEPVVALAWHPAGKRVLVAGRDGGLLFVDAPRA